MRNSGREQSMCFGQGSMPCVCGEENVAHFSFMSLALTGLFHPRNVKHSLSTCLFCSFYEWAVAFQLDFCLLLWMFLVWTKTFVLCLIKLFKWCALRRTRAMQVTSLSFSLSFFPRASRLLRKSRKSAHRHGGGLVGGGNVLLSIRKHVGAKGCLQKSPVPRMECVT